MSTAQVARPGTGDSSRSRRSTTVAKKDSIYSKKGSIQSLFDAIDTPSKFVMILYIYIKDDLLYIKENEINSFCHKYGFQKVLCSK